MGVTGSATVRFVIFVTLLGGSLVMLLQGINGAVSPLYYVADLHGEEGNIPFLPSVALAVSRGAMTGLAGGAMVGTGFALAVRLIPRAASPLHVARLSLLRIAVCVVLGWFLGGSAGVWLATVSPEFLQMTFVGVPSGHSDVLRYAWVGGSLWGMELGGAAITLKEALAFWKRFSRPTSATPVGSGPCAF